MKTIKHFGILICCILGISPIQAQLSGGITAAASTGAVEMENMDQGFRDVVNGKNITGFEGGIFLKYKAGPVYIKPMAMYTYQSGTVTYNGEDFSYKASKVGVPLMFGLHVIGPVALEAGPVYNYLVDVNRQYGEYNWQAGRNGLGYRAGLALNFGALSLNASYEGMTFMRSSNQIGYKEPYRLLFGAALSFGGK